MSERRPRVSPRRWAVGMALLFGLIAWRPWPRGEQPAALLAFGGVSMGTTYSVKVVPIEPEPALHTAARERAAAAVRLALERVDAAMSTYRADSELVRFNRHGTEPFPASAPTLEVFGLAREISALSGGAFDVTVGPLVDAWGFGPPGRVATPPTEASLASLRERVGWQRIEVDAAAGILRKERPDVAADLSAIASGYAVDRAAAALEHLGYDRFIVEVGGEVRARGLNTDGEPWQVGVERPDPERRVIERVVPLRDGALATSGNYRNFYVDDRGERISHTIDPHTGRPITRPFGSVTVVSDTCARADALAAALNVLGPHDGWELAVREGLAVLFIVQAGDGRFEERGTPAFEALVAKGAPGGAGARSSP